MRPVTSESMVCRYSEEFLNAGRKHYGLSDHDLVFFTTHMVADIEHTAHSADLIARLVRDVTVGPSPAWLKERLEAIGLRPINNVVDVTNFVLWETGQPLHAFDLDKLEGPEIRVRRARAGETLVTLDGVERALGEEILVIADAVRPVRISLISILRTHWASVGLGSCGSPFSVRQAFTQSSQPGAQPGAAEGIVGGRAQGWPLHLQEPDRSHRNGTGGRRKAARHPEMV